MRESTYQKIKHSLALLFILITLGYLSYVFSDILIILCISVLLAMIFNPLVHYLEDKGIKRGWAVFVIFLISGFAIFIGLYYLIPKITVQIQAISQSISKAKIDNVMLQIENFTKTSIPLVDAEGMAAKISDFISSTLFNSFNNISNILSQIVSVLAILIIVPFITFFLIKDNTMIIRAMVNILPNKYFEMVFTVIYKIRVQLGRFVRSWLLDALIVGLLSGIGLTVLGIQNSFTIGLVAALGHLIPYFGPIVGGIPAIIISVVQFGNLSMLPSIVVMFLIVYAIDNGIIQPNLFAKSTDLHPLVIILLILAGNEVLGMIGMLLAVPTAMVLKTAIRETYLGYKRYRIIRAS